MKERLVKMLAALILTIPVVIINHYSEYDIINAVILYYILFGRIEK